MPAVVQSFASPGGVTTFAIYDDGSMTLKDTSGTTLLSVSAAGLVTAAAGFVYSGVDDFGSTGIKADVIAESTAATGVTIDGALIKDAHILDSVGFYDAAAPTKIARIDAGGVTAGNTRVLAAPDSDGTLAVLGLAQSWSATQTFLGSVFNSTMDMNSIIDQDTADTTGTGSAYDSLGTSTSATGSYAIIKGTFQQLTNAKTAGVGFGVQGTYVGLAGDTAGAIVGGLYAAAPTLNGGSATDCGLAIAAGYTNDIYFVDTSAIVTFQDAAAAGLIIRDAGGNNFLVLDSAATDGMTFGNATTNPAYTFLGSGAFAFGTGTVTLPDGSTLVRSGAGTGTGDIIEVIGPDAAHGMERVVYEATVSPAAIETALLTLPANHYVESVQANIESALTGGGTTVTASIGITGDVDSHGSFGAPTDLLAKNSKLDWMRTGAGAGASLGIFSKSTVALKLIAAATGGASAGDTALTVGSVKVRVVYWVLASIVDAA